MPKKLKKPVNEMTTEELAASVFPKKVHNRLKQIVRELNTEKSPRKKG